SWADQPQLALAHYDAAFLFLRYFLEHYSRPEDLPHLIGQPARGAATFDRYLAQRGASERFRDVFREWVVANLVDAEPRAPRRYRYSDVDVRVQVTERVALPALDQERTVHQYGADYVELVGKGDVVVDVQGRSPVRLVPADPRSGRFFWWSNRGDNADLRLTREVDLRGRDRATLQFWAWWDLETDYDYCYVSASTNGGQTWTSLRGRHTTTRNPTGNNLGHGYTGESGGWVEERVDLTPYTGRRIFLRFECLTDDAFAGPGFAVDDVRIPEIGWTDDAEADGGWQAEGFVRTDNRLPQVFDVQLVEYRGDTLVVRPVPLDEHLHGSAVVRGLGEDVQRAVLVVTASAPATLEPAGYTFTVRPYPRIP
ncbi:MAG TPA: hypothetical protein VIN09_12900, partial [Chloroflexota bacterium]